jgi:hypothetical protein
VISCLQLLRDDRTCFVTDLLKHKTVQLVCLVVLLMHSLDRDENKIVVKSLSSTSLLRKLCLA